MRKRQYHHGEDIREEIILLCMQWYILYDLRYIKLQKVMKQRGLKMKPRTFNHLVKDYSILARKRLEVTTRERKTGWRIVEIPFFLEGRKKYLYRAVDAQSNTLDFMITGFKNKEKAQNFFRQTLTKTQGIKEEVFQEKTDTVNTKNYNFLWVSLIIIGIIIMGKIVDNLQKEKQDSPPSSPTTKVIYEKKFTYNT